MPKSFEDGLNGGKENDLGDREGGYGGGGNGPYGGGGGSFTKNEKGIQKGNKDPG